MENVISKGRPRKILWVNYNFYEKFKLEIGYIHAK